MKYFLPQSMEGNPRGAKPADDKEVEEAKIHRFSGFLILNSSPKYQDQGGKSPRHHD